MTCSSPSSVVEFPAWETLPHERLSPRSDTVGRRLAVLRRLAHPDAEDVEHGPVQVVVAPVRAVLQPMVAGLGELEPVALNPGDEVDLDDVVERLAAAAYTRVDLVERRGEFAVRGGIIDVFPPTDEHPLRVEMWGDTVEEVRWFKVADQRSLEIAEHGLWAPPCREVLLTPRCATGPLPSPSRTPGWPTCSVSSPRASWSRAWSRWPRSWSTTWCCSSTSCPPAPTSSCRTPSASAPARTTSFATSKEFLEASWANAAAGAATPIDLGAAAYRSLADVRARAGELGLPWWSISPFAADESPDEDETSVVAARGVEGYRGDTARALADVKGWLGDGHRVVMLTEGHGSAQRIVEVLSGEDIPARLDETLGDVPAPALVHVACACLGRGFVSESIGLVVLTETDLMGQAGPSTKEMRRLPSRRRNTVDPLQLQPGDYIVHEQHGVGRYVEMVQRTVQRRNSRVPRHRVRAE